MMDTRVLHSVLLPSLAACLLLSVLSCGAPAEKGEFVRQSGKTSDGYVFSVDMSDSLCLHALYFYTMIDASPSVFEKMPDIIPLQVKAVSPSGKVYMENVGIRKDGFSKASFYSRRYEPLYRSGFSLSEYGQWSVRVMIPGEERFKGLRGLGLKHEKL